MSHIFGIAGKLALCEVLTSSQGMHFTRAPNATNQLGWPVRFQTGLLKGVITVREMFYFGTQFFFNHPL